MLGIGLLISAAMAVTKALTVVGMAVQGLKIIGNAIASIAKSLGIIKPERSIDEIGDRALQAEEQGITHDKYASYEAWVKAIEKDDWGYDPEKNKDMEPEKKILKGVEVSTAVTMEKFPNLPIKDFFTIASKNPEFFEIDRMEKIGELANTDVDAFGKVVNYMTGKETDLELLNSAEDILMEIEQTIDPRISEDSAYDRVASHYSTK